MLTNKRADFPTVLIVFLTLFVTGAALFVFITSDVEIVEVIEDVNKLDDLYVNEKQINFYLTELVEENVIETATESGGFNEHRFVDNLIDDLTNRELLYEELKGVEDKIRVENVLFSGERIEFKIEGLKTEKDFSGESNSLVKAQHVFDFETEVDLNS
jgi:hypothetical protein